jgi:6-phosphogluconolactonase
MIIAKEVKEIISEIEKAALEAIKDKGYFVIGFPGGRSVKILFEPLLKSNIYWGKAHIFMVDERLVPIDDDESNFKLISDNLLLKLKNKGLIEKNIHPFILKDNIDSGVLDYTEELKKYGGRFDISIFGVGEDGHIGALFPDTTIKDNKESFFSFHDSPKPPKDRMTSSRKLILKSGLGVFLFIGEGKKEAYQKFNDKEFNVIKCPAKIAQGMNSVVYCEIGGV